MQPSNGEPLQTPEEQREIILPNSPQAAASVGLPDGGSRNTTSHAIASSRTTNGLSSTTFASFKKEAEEGENMRLELQDGTVFEGLSFGSKRSIAGELVFQTGMVGYPESITDPSYRGQILVVTFPLVGNYGVPSRDAIDTYLHDLPAHFESSQIHVAGLVVASYSGEDYSHYLATSSLGTWLKEQNIPAMYGVDTRALTKRIRQEGSMLGRMLVEREKSNSLTNGDGEDHISTTESTYEQIHWVDPNVRNLVADGKDLEFFMLPFCKALTTHQSLFKSLACILQLRKPYCAIHRVVRFGSCVLTSDSNSISCGVCCQGASKSK